MGGVEVHRIAKKNFNPIDLLLRPLDLEDVLGSDVVIIWYYLGHESKTKVELVLDKLGNPPRP